MIQSIGIEKTYKYLLIILAFLMPLSVSLANTVVVIICLLWLFSGDYKAKLYQISNSRVMLASIIFFIIHILGLIWTDNLAWGLHIAHKMWYFIGLFPILYTIVKKEHIRLYISSFLLAISFTEIVSYLIWFELLDPFKNASVENPTPFMSHISYNPILAFAIYLVLHQISFNKKITNSMFVFYGFFAISMSVNMFITGGRAGQVAFFVILSILLVQIFNKERIKSIIVILVVIPSIFFTAYQSSSLFQKRVDFAIEEIIDYSDLKTTSVGVRINFALNSWEVIKNNPIIGVGTGDFPVEYSKVNSVNSPEAPETTNPHNMYILVTMQLGLVGLVSMLSIFYYQIQFSRNTKDKFIKDVGFTLPIMFLVLMWSDSYLLGHFTSLLFVFFGAFLYKDFAKT
jgi:O-antigen ligase